MYKAHKIALFLICTILIACGPNVLNAKGTVMHPLVKDNDELYFIRMVTISRKEPRLRGMHTIVGAYGKPRALGKLLEHAEIPKQHTNGNGLLVTVEIYSVYKDQLVKPQDYKFSLVLPDGRKIKGRLHRVWRLVDLSEKITGGSMRVHQVVRDKKSGSVQVYRHWEEVENDHQLWWRKFRVVFVTDKLITLDTKFVIFEVEGHQRLRRYTFKFTKDPIELMNEEEKKIYNKTH